MMKCTNCYSLFNHTEKEHLELWHQGQIVVLICPLCIETVSRARITLERGYDTATFEYKQYAPVECFKEEVNKAKSKK